MPAVPQQVECPNCWHTFNPSGHSTRRNSRRLPERHGHCADDYTIASAQLAARRKRPS